MGKGTFLHGCSQTDETGGRCFLQDIVGGAPWGFLIDKVLHHLLLHPVIDIGIGQVTAQLLRQLVILRAAYLSDDGGTPLGRELFQVFLDGLVSGNVLPAHVQVVLDGLAVPLAGDLDMGLGGVETGDSMGGIGQIAHDTCKTGFVSGILLQLFAREVLTDAPHDRGKVRLEILVKAKLYLRKSLLILHIFCCRFSSRDCCNSCSRVCWMALWYIFICSGKNCSHHSSLSMLSQMNLIACSLVISTLGSPSSWLLIQSFVHHLSRARSG